MTPCPVPNCAYKSLGSINRHIKSVHRHQDPLKLLEEVKKRKTTKRRLFLCTVQGCGAMVVNLTNHLKYKHHESHRQ